jgi:hypothetical protein
MHNEMPAVPSGNSNWYQNQTWIGSYVIGHLDLFCWVQKIFFLAVI